MTAHAPTDIPSPTAGRRPIVPVPSSLVPTTPDSRPTGTGSPSGPGIPRPTFRTPVDTAIPTFDRDDTDDEAAKKAEQQRIAGWCARHPVRAYRCNRINDEDIAGQAWSESKKYFPEGDGADNRQDAARHCIWLGGMTARGDETIARYSADTHEQLSISQVDGDPSYGRHSEIMDRYNNETGIKIGKESDGDFATVISKCVTAANNARRIPRSQLEGMSNPGDGSLIFFRGR
ncbi:MULTISPECIES: DUF6973 domain-containing protein [unclassified Gordonia (in: high G+C Gram-positive bacteria)]|uniref:DUF6973 domain-containing protein n=1 Tax=Gordonia sp. B7-2 TaxID=3420932 RepID=UPI003D926395